MAHYQSILSYDGTDFHGFQRQADGLRTVQAVVENALEKLGWNGSSVSAAGRTDAGVHARGQVVGFELEWRHGLQALTRALNNHLPADVAIQASKQVEPNFHPRFSAHWRYYRYLVVEANQRDPLRERYAQRIWPPVDLGALMELEQVFLGRHDFRAFGPAPVEGGHTVRSILLMEWARKRDVVQLDVVADAFLQHMVRRIAAASLKVASGKLEPDELAVLVDEPSNRWQGSLAKPGGLSLMQVGYQPWDGPGSMRLTEEGDRVRDERSEDLLSQTR